MGSYGDAHVDIHALLRKRGGVLLHRPFPHKYHLLVTRRAVLARTEYVNQRHSAPVHGFEAMPQSSLRRWGVSKSSGSARAVAEGN